MRRTILRLLRVCQALVRRAGLEPAVERSTRPSIWRVYQFRHLRMCPNYCTKNMTTPRVLTVQQTTEGSDSAHRHLQPLAGRCRRLLWCLMRDSNSQWPFGRRLLRPLCLPIPPTRLSPVPRRAGTRTRAASRPLLRCLRATQGKNSVVKGTGVEPVGTKVNGFTVRPRAVRDYPSVRGGPTRDSNPETTTLLRRVRLPIPPVALGY